MPRLLRLSFLCLLLHASAAMAQLEMSVFTATGRGGVATTFVTDYQAIGINPANLGIRRTFRDPRLTLGLMEGNIGFYSQAMNRREVFNTIASPTSSVFDYNDKIAAARRFSNSELSFNSDMMLFGAAYSTRKGHGFAVNVRDRIQLYTKLNATAAELMFMGANSSYFPVLALSDGTNQPNPRFGNPNAPFDPELLARTVVGFFPDTTQASNYSQILDGSRISSSWTREFNFAYGGKIYESYDLAIYGGAGFKFIQGLVLLDIASQNGRFDNSIISVSPTFGLTFPDSVQPPSFRPPQQGASVFRQLAYATPVGRGYGVDLGLTVVIKRKLYVAVALNNFGQLTWESNTYRVTDGRLAQFAGQGFNNYNFFAGSGSTFQFAGSESPFKWRGTGRTEVELPSTFRLGVSYDWYKTVHFGIDIIQPRNRVSGNLERTLWAVGADIRPYKRIRISAGISGGGNSASKINFPLGISYISLKDNYEAGLATKDLSTYAGDFGTGSTVSFAMGFLRFKLF